MTTDPKPGEGVPAPIVAPIQVGVTWNPSTNQVDVRIAPGSNLALITLALAKAMETIQADILNKQARAAEAAEKQRNGVQIATASSLRALPR